MNGRAILAVPLVGFLAVASGCTGRLIKESMGVAMGAKGATTMLQPVPQGHDARPLGVYERFELGQIRDDTNGQTPAAVFSLLPGAFEKQLADKKIPNAASGKTLLIRGKVLHYEDSGLVGQVFGPLEEVVARIELVDKETGKVLGVANCVGRTQESVNIGVQTKVEGLAKAIVRWIDKLYPEEKRIREE